MADTDLTLRSFVSVEVPNGVSQSAKVTIGGQIILEAPADLVDIKALEENTELKIIQEGNNAEGKPESASSAGT